MPPASSSDGNDGPPALSLLPGESLAKYQEPSTEASFESEAGALLAGSEDTDDARDIGAAESSDLPLSAVSMAELDSEEEEEVAEVLAAAEVLSGSFLEAESEGATNSEALAAEERFEALGTGQTRESFSELAAPALDEAVAPLAAPTVADTPFAQVSSSKPSGTSAPAESSATTSEPTDFTGADSGSPTPTPGENATGAAVMTVAQGESTGTAGTAPGTAAGVAKAQFRNAPGTSRFFRRGTDRRHRPGGYEAREEGSTAPSAPLIADLLKEGQEILVQIAKEPLGTKGARITSHIALPGRYLVYMPTVDHIGVSRKIESDEERQRLKRIIQENRRNQFPGGLYRSHRRTGQRRGRVQGRYQIPLRTLG